MTSEGLLATASWRKSSFSGGGANGGGGCVELAALGDSRIAIRDSKNPSGCRMLCTRAELNALLHGIRSGRFD